MRMFSNCATFGTGYVIVKSTVHPALSDMAYAENNFMHIASNLTCLGQQLYHY